MSTGISCLHDENRHKVGSRTLLVCACLTVFAVRPAAGERHDPVADSKAIVTSGNARFTVLTPELIRMEWAADARFEDRASLVFIVRRLPVPRFETREEAGRLIIDTGELELRYRKGGGRFGAENLEIRFSWEGGTRGWHPGMEDDGNLGGTIRTLDGVGGPVPLEPGLLSRHGWVLIDDSDRPLFDGGDWPWVVNRPAGDRLDWYFFGYGRDYRRALHDFTRVSGKMPMPPRFAFGNWWSRYWAYTDQELVDLARQHEVFGVPLDVLVIDMDWHETFELRWDTEKRDQAGQRLGWTGYTWNETYFPDPETFLAWAEAKGLETPLNLHPASGIQPHEAQYEAMARAMGIDPASKKYVPFRIEDERFALAYFEHVIHPLEKQGVDFWWLDWQQWHETSIPHLTPTWWLNYVFFTEMERHRETRPIIMHRWGGLGNHRYPIGFSGDAHSTWEALAFEPYFTATAANVGFGYWSHDIGGHLPGEVSPELYTRWIQFGVFSPIFRTHTTKNPKAERRIWAYPADYFEAMREAVLLRYELLPYIYSASRLAYDTGVSIVRPLYYDYPEAEEAYDFTGEYFFGEDLLVSPVTDPADPESLLAKRSIWLPEGQWIEWFTGARLTGPGVFDRSFALDEVPVYARAGAVVPMTAPVGRAGEIETDPLILTLFPGGAGGVRIYQDEGDSLGYQKQAYSWTRARQSIEADGSIRVELSAPDGSFPGMPAERAVEIRLLGNWPPEEVLSDGVPVPYSTEGRAPGWTYDGNRLMSVVRLTRAPVMKNREVLIRLPLGRDASLLDGVPGLLSRAYRATALLNGAWPGDWAPESLIDLVQTGRRISLDPARAESELRRLEEELPAAIEAVRAVKGDTALINRALAHLGAQGESRP